MKRVPMLMAVFLLLSAALGFGQNNGQELMEASIPFSFVVGADYLPAGDYRIETVVPQRMIRVYSVDGEHSAFVVTVPNSIEAPAEKSSLLFDRLGGSYYLLRVSTAGQDERRDLILSDKASRLARNQKQGPPTVVAGTVRH
jgi:hypothetical protein